MASPERIGATLRSTREALLFATPDDLAAVEVALAQMESAGDLLRGTTEIDPAAHAALRGELDATATLARSLLEELLAARDQLAAEIASRRDEDSSFEFQESIDLMS
jgi:hypothetical protein